MQVIRVGTRVMMGEYPSDSGTADIPCTVTHVCRDWVVVRVDEHDIDDTRRFPVLSLAREGKYLDEDTFTNQSSHDEIRDRLAKLSEGDIKAVLTLLGIDFDTMSSRYSMMQSIEQCISQIYKPTHEVSQVLWAIGELEKHNLGTIVAQQVKEGPSSVKQARDRFSSLPEEKQKEVLVLLGISTDTRNTSPAMMRTIIRRTSPVLGKPQRNVDQLVAALDAVTKPLDAQS